MHDPWVNWVMTESDLGQVRSVINMDGSTWVGSFK